MGELFWSPDGSRIYFVRATELMSVSAAGGEPLLVSTAAPGGEGRPAVPSGQIRAACISPNGRTIVFARGGVGDLHLWTLDTGTRESRPMNPGGMP
jgi:Tol biopolymer transport system component